MLFFSKLLKTISVRALETKTWNKTTLKTIVALNLFICHTLGKLVSRIHIFILRVMFFFMVLLHQTNICLCEFPPLRFRLVI